MSTKQIIVGMLWAVAFVLFLIAGFTVWEPKDLNLIGLGLASAWAGLALNFLWVPSP